MGADDILSFYACVALKAFAFVSPLTAVIVQAAIVAFSVILEKFKR